MKSELDLWEESSDELSKKMDEWRESYYCRNNCEEWQKWKFCKHLIKARSKKFRCEIDDQIISLIKINSKVIPLEPSQSSAIF